MSQKIPCQCGNEVEVLEPRLELINQLTVSMIIWAHPEQTACDRCGMAFIPLIAGIPMEHMKCTFKQVPVESLPPGMPVKREQQSRIINPFK
jgi:hypothetical protein